MLDTAEVTREFIETIIEIIGRKTSQEYAAVSLRNHLKKLQRTYHFLQFIEIKSTRSLEMERTVTVQESLNMVHPKKVGNALKELLKVLMNSLGRTIGYFFIREIREKIGIEYDTMLLKTMDVDLTFLQSTYIVEKKSINLLDVQNSDVVRRFIKALIDVVERQTSKTFAILLIVQHVDALREQYPFLQSIVITDVRYTLGSEEVVVHQEINDVDKQELGRAINAMFEETEKTLADLGRDSVAADLKMQLTKEYLAKLGEIGVKITPYNVGYSKVFNEVIKTLIDLMSITSTKNDAILTVNTFLGKMQSKYPFLKYIKVESATNRDGQHHITMFQDIDTISQSDARRSIQQLLENIMDFLEEEISVDFIQQFKDSLDKKYLSKLDDIGVNFHMIELHHIMLTRTK